MKAKSANYITLEFLSRSANEGFARGAVACFAAQLDPTLEELGDIKTPAYRPQMKPRSTAKLSTLNSEASMRRVWWRRLKLMLRLGSMQTMHPTSCSIAFSMSSMSCLVFPSPEPLIISLTI